MRSSRFEQAIPIIGSCFGGFICGVIARNGFIGWTGETLAAGFLGLIGGAFAYVSAKMQIKATEEQTNRQKLQDARKAEADFYIEAYFVVTHAIKNIDRIQPWFEDEEYPGDDCCKICIEILRLIEIPRPPFTVGTDVILEVQQANRTKGLLITMIESSISAMEDHADRNSVIMTMLRDLKEVTESLRELASEGLEGMNDQS